MLFARNSLGALLAGSLMPLGFAPFELYPVVVLSLALLFALWRYATPVQAFVTGALFGLGMFLFGVSWVFISMYDYGHVSLSLSVFLTLLFVTVLALFPALAGWLAVRIRRTGTAYADLAMVLVFPAGWVLFEWFRGWFMTGFPWLLAGYSQLDAPLSGYAPLTGVYGLSLLVAVCAVLLVIAVDNDAGRIRGLPLFAIVMIWLAGAVLGHVRWTTPDQNLVRVSLIQGNIPQDMKWFPGMRQPTLELYRRQTEKHWNSDLVIWPETALPLFSDQAEVYLDNLADEAQMQKTDLLLGLVYRDPASGRYYNSMLGIGKQISLYHKRHLVPFTEFLPLKNVFAGIVGFLDVPMSDFSAGDRTQRPLPLAGQHVGISICYEDAFGEEVIDQLPEATLLVNVSNDAWFTGSVAPAQHLQMARMRALETGRTLLRATNTGISAIIGADGRIIREAPRDQLAVLDGMVRPRSGATPYVMTGNIPVLCLAGAMLLAGGVVSRRL